MNVYEEAHKLAESIKSSGEYQEFQDIKKEVDEDPDLSNSLKDFQKKQFQFQAKQMTGETPDSSLMEQIQSMYAIIAANPLAAKYLQAEARFSIMMKDVYEILGDIVNISFK
ncbi:MAG: YlbF family regulator [Clostridiales bacterium]|jgi:cell fate (sporulation/competence/biofilm development) regulator YlbF (YheA/YmcA/DUF963 family)|nr:YlbF family regulator [Clostridiales bacterium]